MVPDEGEPGNTRPGRSPGGSAVVALLVVFPLAQLVSTAVMVLAKRASSGEGTLGEWMAAQAGSPLGVVLMIVPIQAMTLLATLFFVRNERDRARALGLRRSALPAHVTLLLVLGTPVLQVAAFVLVHLSGLEPSPQLERLQELLGRSTGATAVLFTLLATIVPAFCEELFFRGYVQPRLAARFGPLVAVLVSGLVFALYHGDPLQVITVIPPGLWFAYLAWRARSTFVPMAAHLVFNAMGVGIARLPLNAASAGEPPELAPWSAVIVVGCLGFSALALSMGLWLAGSERPAAGDSA